MSDKERQLDDTVASALPLKQQTNFTDETSTPEEHQESAKHKDALSRLQKDAMTPSDWHEYFKYVLENKIDASISFTTTDSVISFLRYARMNSNEDVHIDAHGLIRILIENELAIDVKKYAKENDPACRELMHKLRDYVTAFQEYIKKLDASVASLK